MRKIGFFDSGVGGLTIWKEVVDLLPGCDTIYIADSANAPYGSKSTEDIISISKKNVSCLIEKGCDIIVVACNTATTQAIEMLRNSFDLPIIGIEPAVKPAALASATGLIGVLATAGTIESAHFKRTKSQYDSNVEVKTQVGEGLVTAIENGGLHSSELKGLLKEHLAQLIEPQMSHLVLGCTHYPLLIPLIREILTHPIEIVDSGLAVAKRTKEVMIQHGLKCAFQENGTHQFFSTGNLEVMKSITQELTQNGSNICYSSLYQSE